MEWLFESDRSLASQSGRDCIEREDTGCFFRMPTCTHQTTIIHKQREKGFLVFIPHLQAANFVNRPFILMHFIERLNRKMSCYTCCARSNVLPHGSRKTRWRHRKRAEIVQNMLCSVLFWLKNRKAERGASPLGRVDKIRGGKVVRH
jgi:hypothetical protein